MTANPETVLKSDARTLSLTPRIHPGIIDFLEDRTKLGELERALGSPLNILFPEHLDLSLGGFSDAFDKHGVAGRVYFAHKANQSDSLLRQMSVKKVFVDVSSPNELKHALAAGFDGARLEATGPKNAEFLALCLQHGVTINLDSLAELRMVLSLRERLSLAHRTKVLLRLSGFQADHSRFLNKASRFGVPVDQLAEAFALLSASHAELDFLGLSFHLDTVSIPERAVAIENCLRIFEQAMEAGLEPRVLDIGGGYKVNYLACESEWNAYTSALRESVLGHREQLCWQGNSFGLSADKGGKLRGNFNSYNYYDRSAGGLFLDELLSFEFADLGGRTTGSLLRDNMIELWIEPGRSLVDQCGITVARVNSLRASSKGDTLVCLNMKRQDISFLDQEVFVDPIIVHKERTSQQQGSHPVYFAGNLCLESDLIYRHKTFLPRLPEVGDLVVFINTAGYFMDFSATTSIMQPKARKIAVFRQDGGFGWTMDDQYSPLHSFVGEIQSC